MRRVYFFKLMKQQRREKMGKVLSIQKEIKSDLCKFNFRKNLSRFEVSNKNNFKCDCVIDWHEEHFRSNEMFNGFGREESVFPLQTISKSLRMQNQFCQASKANKQRLYQVSDSNRFVLSSLPFPAKSWMKRRRLRKLELELIAKTW